MLRVACAVRLVVLFALSLVFAYGFMCIAVCWTVAAPVHFVVALALCVTVLGLALL